MEGLKSGPNTQKNQESYDINETLENTGSGKAIRLSVTGSKNYGLVQDLLVPNRSTEKSYAEIAEVLKIHFQRKPTEIVQRYEFYTRNRKTRESCPDFEKTLSQNRKYNNRCYGTKLFSI